MLDAKALYWLYVIGWNATSLPRRSPSKGIGWIPILMKNRLHAPWMSSLVLHTFVGELI